MYQHILLALNTGESNSNLVNKAFELAGLHNARLTLLHVVDFIPSEGTDPAGLGQSLELSQQLLHTAKHTVEQIAATAPNGILVDTQVTLGAARHEIVNHAEQRQCDLILIGHHPHRGLGHLLGHTDESVLHHAPCDVLAIKLATP